VLACLVQRNPHTLQRNAAGRYGIPQQRKVLASNPDYLPSPLRFSTRDVVSDWRGLIGRRDRDHAGRDAFSVLCIRVCRQALAIARRSPVMIALVPFRFGDSHEAPNRENPSHQHDLQNLGRHGLISLKPSRREGVPYLRNTTSSQPFREITQNACRPIPSDPVDCLYQT